MKLIKKMLKSKVLYLAVSLFSQLLVLFVLTGYFSREFLPVYYLMIVLSVIICIYVINRDSDTSSKILWVFMIMVLPVFGGIMYLLFGGRKIPKALMVEDRQASIDYVLYRERTKKAIQNIAASDPTLKKMSNMALNNGSFPTYDNTSAYYYPTGQEQFASILNELEKAEKYIFIETYILDEGLMWTKLLDVLQRKAAQGVDVRMIYDDFGSILNMDKNYPAYLRSLGIDSHTFNPIRPQLAIQMNNRDHRKTIIVDGKTAFTGGTNIADEYINEKERFGYWKDMGAMVKGPAVESFVIAFLQIWNYASDTNTPYDHYVRLPEEFEEQQGKGYVIPFFDSPTDSNMLGKNFHLNMLASAQESCWITTPYLILDAEMISAMELAVKNGVDVRVVVPGIPDKKMVYSVTQAHIRTLIEKGVRVYVYTPGFIHGKVTLSDGKHALCGTVNMDFRSYYYNYECGIWMYDTECIPDIKEDFEQIFSVSQEVSQADVEAINPLVRLYQNVLRIFSPLL